MAPIIARTVATFSPVKMNGRADGMRTRRKMSTSPAAYERISSIDSGRTEVRPRRVVTSTGKKQRTPAIAHLECGLRTPNHAFVIGAKAMIGMAFAATAYGMSASPTRRQRAKTSATRIAAEQPVTKPPSASLNVNQPAWTRTLLLSQNVVAIAVGLGNKNFPASGEKTHC